MEAFGGKEAVERSKTNAHTDIHSNEKRHFTTQRGSTSISQTHLCHPVFPHSIKNISKGWFSAHFSQSLLLEEQPSEILIYDVACLIILLQGQVKYSYLLTKGCNCNCNSEYILISCCLKTSIFFQYFILDLCDKINLNIDNIIN